MFVKIKKNYLFPSSINYVKLKWSKKGRKINKMKIDKNLLKG
ncbi:unnamed protein product, partial [marine sediment metagenome]